MVIACLQRLLKLALCAVLLGAGAAHAQAGLAGQPIATCLQRDTGQAAMTLLQQPQGFDCRSPQHRWGRGDFWAISAVEGGRSTWQRPLVLRFASLWQDNLQIYLLYADGKVVRYATDARGITPWIQLGAYAQLPVPVRAAPLIRVLWHVEGSANVRGIVKDARLTTLEESQHATLWMALLYATFGGMSLALIVYNMALWCAMRHRFQLHYCALLAAMFGYMISSSGLLAWLMPAMANNDRLRLNYLFIGLAGGAAAMFTRSFFEQRVMTPWLDRTTQLLAAVVPLSGALVLTFGAINLQLMDLIYTLCMGGLLAIVAPMIVAAWRQRSNFLWLFSIAWSAPILFGMVRVAASLHLIRWSFWIDNSTVLSMMVEAQLSALAVAHRIRFLRDERDDAITREVLARRLADTDPLTGLLNRRAFLHQAIGRTGEQQLLLADIDHFKRVNDTLGHDGGDEVLRLFARALRASVPTGALVARMGGEEFAILTDATHPIDPESLLARLRGARMPFDLKVTASIGACSGPLSTDVEWKSLYRGADAALFDAKAAGRDRVRQHLREVA